MVNGLNKRVSESESESAFQHVFTHQLARVSNESQHLVRPDKLFKILIHWNYFDFCVVIYFTIITA